MKTTTTLNSKVLKTKSYFITSISLFLYNPPSSLYLLQSQRFTHARERLYYNIITSKTTNLSYRSSLTKQL